MCGQKSEIKNCFLVCIGGRQKFYVSILTGLEKARDTLFVDFFFFQKFV